MITVRESMTASRSIVSTHDQGSSAGLTPVKKQIHEESKIRGTLFPWRRSGECPCTLTHLVHHPTSGISISESLRLSHHPTSGLALPQVAFTVSVTLKCQRAGGLSPAAVSLSGRFCLRCAGQANLHNIASPKQQMLYNQHMQDSRAESSVYSQPEPPLGQ